MPFLYIVWSKKKNTTFKRQYLSTTLSPSPSFQKKKKGKGKDILFRIGGQTGKDCLITWADGVKVADRRDRTRDLSLRKRCTHHCTMGPHRIIIRIFLFFFFQRYASFCSTQTIQYIPVLTWITLTARHAKRCGCCKSPFSRGAAQLFLAL